MDGGDGGGKMGGAAVGKIVAIDAGVPYVRLDSETWVTDGSAQGLAVGAGQ